MIKKNIARIINWHIMSTATKVANNTKMTNAALISAPFLASAGLYAMSDDNEQRPIKEEDVVVDDDSEMSFMQFLRSYRIGQIPIMDLIIIYIIIYISNALYFKCSYQMPLLISIIITIALAMLFDKNFKLSIIILIILAIAVYLLLANNYCTKKN